MRYLFLRMKRFCGFITGLVFFLGGILKLMDPVGAGLVMKEYLDFLHIGFMDFASKPAAVLFALAETTIGTALVTGIYRKATAIATLSFQGFFTLLTLLLVIFNPDMDCGCFGEAIHLSHKQTFIKNIFLCVLIAAYAFPFKMLGTALRHKFVSFYIVTASVICFTIYSLMFIPMVDFTDFKATARLQAGNTSHTEDMYESIFIYEKDGQQEAFDLEHLPDSTWTFVRTDTRIKDGSMENNTINLSFYDESGNYHDERAADGKVMVISVYDSDINSRKWNKIAEFMDNSSKAGFRPLLLVNEAPEKQDSLRYYVCDYKTLMTLNRSNGGITYFNDGYLISKWSGRAAPDMEELEEIAHCDKTETIIEKNTRGSIGFQGFLLYVFAVMLLL